MSRLIVCLTLGVVAVHGQDEAVRRFEVASVKVSAAGPGSSGITTTNGLVRATNVTLQRCIMGAYKIGPNQIAGGPDWLESDRFDITAKTPEKVGDSVLMEMMQTLLAERFQLKVHREPRPINVYVLDVAKNGPKLTPGDGGGSSTDNKRGNLTLTNTTMDRFAEALLRQLDCRW